MTLHVTRDSKIWWPHQLSKYGENVIWHKLTPISSKRCTKVQGIMIQVNIIKYSKIKWYYYFSDKISKKWLFFWKGERGWQVGFGYEKFLNFIFLPFNYIKKILKISSWFCKWFWGYVWFVKWCGWDQSNI